MSRRIIFTEQQLKRIIGEDIYDGAYIDMNSSGSEFEPDSNEMAGETNVSEPSDEANPLTTDEYGRGKTPKSYSFRGSYTTMYESDKKKLNERNKQLDGKKNFSLPQNLRKLAVSNGVNDDIMDKLASGEKMDIAGLYRVRKEIENNPNTTIKKGVDNLIKQAQNMGSALRGVQSNIDDMLDTNARNGKNKGHRKEGSLTIYYENN